MFVTMFPLRISFYRVRQNQPTSRASFNLQNYLRFTKLRLKAMFSVWILAGALFCLHKKIPPNYSPCWLLLPLCQEFMGESKKKSGLPNGQNNHQCKN